MNKYVISTLLVLATIASGNCAPNYGAQVPPVQQVSLSTYPNLDQYLNGPGPYNAPVASYSSPAYAPATAVVAPSAPSYVSASAQNSAAAPAYSSPASAPSYNVPAASPSYGSVPNYAAQPAYTSQIYAGQQNYKAYEAPKVSSRASLPIINSEHVARLFVPRGNSYGPSAPY